MPQLSEHLIADICSKIRISGSLDTALATCGYSRAEMAELDPADPLAVRLFAGIESAESETKLLREHKLTSYFETDWRALAWWLERKYPKEYGARPAKDAPAAGGAGDDMESLLSLLPKV